jgi:hypothetical protein
LKVYNKSTFFILRSISELERRVSEDFSCQYDSYLETSFHDEEDEITATTTFVEQDKKATFADSFCQASPLSRDVGVQIRILSGFPVGCQTDDMALRGPSIRSERTFESPETSSHATAGKPTTADRGETTSGSLFVKGPKLEICGSILHKSDLYR